MLEKVWFVLADLLIGVCSFGVWFFVKNSY